jgi:hypothetical protein
LGIANDAQIKAYAAVPATVKGTYSWLFDKTKGLQIWNGNGTPNKDNIIFQITDGSLWMRGSGTFVGEGSFTGDLHTGLLSDGSYAFNVDKQGNVTMKGGINLAGNVNWSSSASPTQVVYARTSITKPTNGTAYSSFASSSSTTWHRTFDAANDKYASYTYDGGSTWGAVI